MKVGYLGPEKSTFGYMAALKHFGVGEEVEYVPVSPQPTICTAVRHGMVDFGVVAVENVIDGAVFETIRAMRAESSFGVRVCGEVTIPIEIFLLRAMKDGTLPRKVLSHQTAVRQCSKFVAELAKQGVEVAYAASTGEAALQAKGNPDIAALGPAILEETVGLTRVSEASVVDEPDDNFTRFWVLGMRNNTSVPTGKDKTSLLVSLGRGEPGSLCRSLQPFEQAGINLCFMFPIPIARRRWEYTFLMELEAHIGEPKMESAIEALEEGGALCVKVLGSYPNSSVYS